MRIRIRTSIILSTIIILLLAIGINTVINNSIFTKEYSEVLKLETSAAGQSLKFQLNKLLSLGLPLDEIIGFEEQCKDIVEGYKGISYVMVIDYDGEIVFHNDPVQHGKKIIDSELLDALKQGKEKTKLSSYQGEEYYDVMLPVFGLNKEPVAGIIAGLHRDMIKQKIRKLMSYSILTSLISLVMVIIFSIFISGLISRPIKKLAQTVDEVSKGNFGVNIEQSNIEEINVLVDSLNRVMKTMKLAVFEKKVKK